MSVRIKGINILGNSDELEDSVMAIINSNFSDKIRENSEISKSSLGGVEYNRRGFLHKNRRLL